MARRIAGAGFPLTIWARRPATIAAFADTRATVATTPAEVGAASNVVGICVLADEDVNEVVLGDDGVLAGMSSGGSVMVHSTIHPQTVVALAKHAGARGVALIDAPVSGGAVAAENGTLVVLAGGAPDDVARCRPVLESFADTVIHLGPVGSGQKAKLINNLVVTAHLAIATEAFGFAECIGVDRRALASVLGACSGSSNAATYLASCDFDLGGMFDRIQRVLQKDFDVVSDLAHAHGLSAPQAIVTAAREFLSVSPT